MNKDRSGFLMWLHLLDYLEKQKYYQTNLKSNRFIQEIIYVTERTGNMKLILMSINQLLH